MHIFDIDILFPNDSTVDKLELMDELTVPGVSIPERKTQYVV